ncbi:MAG: hypothetical protein J7539_09495 [Niabella sp.]|nr:hypothetical protein [Niabella sp.]
MKKLIFNLLLLCFSLINVAGAQSIVYADVNNTDVPKMNFEIIGKLASNYLVYKEVKGNHQIAVFNENMQQLQTVPITLLPRKNDLLDVSFFTFSNFAWLVYQYQQGNIVFCSAARIEPNGSILQAPVVLDTTMIAYKADRKIYTVLQNGDRSKLVVFKINKKDRSLHAFTEKLFDAQLAPLGESRFGVPMKKSGDYLTGYSLANNGDFAFVKYNRLGSGDIQDAALLVKQANSNTYQERPLAINNLFLDDIKLKADEANDRYLLTSFYSEKKRGNIAGLYANAISIGGLQEVFEKTTPFNEELKKKMSGRSNSKTAFNDLFINSIIIHTNGGFSVAAEALYTTGGGWDRWGYWGSPYGFYGSPYGFYGGGFGWGWGWGGYWSPYYYYSPFFYRSYWWGGLGNGYDYVRYNAGNLAVFSFDKDGNRVTENIIYKNQSESGTDGTISYQVLLKDDQMHFVMNEQGKIADLDDVMITEDGQLTENEPVEAKDKFVDFMPRYGKQVGAATMIIPYLYKRNISFAKVTF